MAIMLKKRWLDSERCYQREGTVEIRAGMNTPSDEYDSYREYRVANLYEYVFANILFLRGC